MHVLFRRWLQDPIVGAFWISVLFSLILFPYWWLAVQWSCTIIPDTATQFTFASTTFLLILAIIDSAFLIRYYQIRRKNDLEYAALQVKKGAENYRLLIENAPFPIVITTLEDNTIVIVNKEAAALFAINPFERVGKPVSNEIITESSKQKIRQILFEKQYITDFEVSFLTKERERVYASLSANIIDYFGEKAVFLAFINISERVRLEKELIKKEEKFSTVFHEVPNPLMILSEDNIIIDVNRGCESFFDMKKDDFINKNIADFDFFPELDEDYFSLTRNNQREPIETLITRQDGQQRYIILHVRIIAIQDIPHSLLLIQDIDLIKRTQNAISQANNQLSILNSITRHDILNRVMVIISYGELLHKSVTEEPALSWLNNIMKSGEDIHTLVDFTRQYQDLGVNPPRWQNIRHLMKKRSILSLITDIEISLPEEQIEIYADPMFEKVLYNLIDNSIRHGEGVTRIAFSYETAGPDLILRYTDNGAGISREDKTRIFTKGFGKNTGLGLFLIREILHLTGIAITETGTPGSGVQFDITVPVGVFRPAKNAHELFEDES